MANDHDIVILGSGSTAFAAALRAQSLGASVLMIEKGMLGGTCINWGCIPSKTLIHSAQFYQEARLAARIGLGMAQGNIDFSRLMAHKDGVVKDLRQSKYLDVLRNVPGLTLMQGTARFIAPQQLAVGEKTISCKKILIATGGVPRIINIPGLQEIDYLTSQSALLLKTFPPSFLIVGGGVIALELGQMFHRLGTKVTIIEHGPRVLPSVEEEPALAVQELLREEGVEIVLGAAVCGVMKRGEQTVVEVEAAGGRHEFSAARLLLAVGTAPASSGIGLELAGVAVDEHCFIRVDEQMRTNVPGIWAAGDVIGGMMIATVGAREGIVAVDDMLNPGCGCRMEYLSVPMAIFTDPEVAMVGYGEVAARAAGFQVVTNTILASAIPKAHVTGSTGGVIKMVADATTGRLLGVHLATSHGAELINEAALAVRFKLTIEDLVNTLHVYPSMGEGLRLCAQGFSRDLSKLSCCAE